MVELSTTSYQPTKPIWSLDLAHLWEIDCEDALTDVLDQIYPVA